MNLELTGLPLLSELAEYSLVMNFPGAVVLITSSLTLESPTGRRTISPETDPPEAFAPIRALIGKTVTRSEVDMSGNLAISFNEGSTIQVEPTASYESWTVHTPSGFTVVCTAGGELAIWGPGQPEDSGQ